MFELASAPTTKIEIISAAIALVGKQQTVNTIDGGGALAVNAEKLYDILVSAELASNRWRFAQDYSELSILNTLEPQFDGWLYWVELPADALMIQSVQPSLDYTVFGNRILTRSKSRMRVVFSKNVAVSKWPGAFSLYIVYALASMMGMSVANSDRLLARLENEKSHWESRALFADAQSSRSTPMRYNPYIAARYTYRTRGGY